MKMAFANSARTWWWLIHKDLQRELRAPRMWPMMLLLAIFLAFVIEMQLDVPLEAKKSVIGGMFWLAVLFAGIVSFDRTIASENDEGCWHGLNLYPISPAMVFLAKLALNFVALCCLDVLLVPAFAVLSDVSLLVRPLPFLSVLAAANMGFAAIGTLVATITNGMRHRSNLLVLLLLPLASPVILGAAEATRSLTISESDVWWRWNQLLLCFAAMFVALGCLMFEFVVEE